MACVGAWQLPGIRKCSYSISKMLLCRSCLYSISWKWVELHCCCVQSRVILPLPLNLWDCRGLDQAHCSSVTFPVPFYGQYQIFHKKIWETLERLFAWLCLVLTLCVVIRDYFRVQGMEIYSLLVIHAWRSLVYALHVLNCYLSTAFSHVNALQPGVSQSNNVLSWELFYWFFFLFLR